MHRLKDYHNDETQSYIYEPELQIAFLDKL